MCTGFLLAAKEQAYVNGWSMALGSDLKSQLR